MLLRVLLLVSALLLRVSAQDGSHDAIHRLLTEFDRHAVVAVAEAHRVEQDKQFLLSVIGSPEFPHKANDIVIEFGSARFQTVLDRYIAGQRVSREAVRHVWADTTVVNGLWEAPVYERFLGTVRERNRGLPRRQKLRVLACDPPINWAKVKTVADAAPFLGRDRYCADVIEREVFAKRHRALVIMGDAHVSRRDITGKQLDNTVTLVERKHPGAVFVVLTYLGQYKDSVLIEKRLAAGPVPTLMPLAGTWLGELPSVPPRPPTRTRVGGGQATKEVVAVTNPSRLDEVGDALLYLTPKAGLTRSRPSADRFSPEDLRELERRHQILFGLPLDRQVLLQ